MAKHHFKMDVFWVSVTINASNIKYLWFLLTLFWSCFFCCFFFFHFTLNTTVGVSVGSVSSHCGFSEKGLIWWFYYRNLNDSLKLPDPWSHTEARVTNHRSENVSAGFQLRTLYNGEAGRCFAHKMSLIGVWFQLQSLDWV